jgi:serine/threonine protein kinase
MPDEPGEMLSHYRLIEKIGEGGMGVVYRAEDTDLKRPVALKFLTGGGFSAHARRARFRREARLAAALNHPVICTIYEVAEVQPGDTNQLSSGEEIPAGTPFVVMEFIEGRGLDEVLRQSDNLPLDDVLRIAVRVAEGLAVAHERGIVHRDLKPGNVMLTKDGRAKILDFGLAKHLWPTDPGDEVLAEAETVSRQLTRAGVVVGTMAYMSPEQARGTSLDSRSDIFSFGIMLYEMVAGRRPFRGETGETTRLKIIEAEPDPLPAACQDVVPRELERIIRRCLRKKPDERYNDTRDLLIALKDLRQETSSGHQRVAVDTTRTTSAEGPTLRGRLIRWTLAAIAVVAVGVTGALLYRSLTGQQQLQQRSPRLPPVFRQITFTGSVSSSEISPDGQTVAYVQPTEDGKVELMVRDLAGGQPLGVLQAESLDRLRWSPDGAEILTRARTGPAGSVCYLVPRFGGVPRPLRCFGYFSWSPDGTQFTSAGVASKEISIVEKSTGERSSLPLEGSFVWLRDVDWSPNDDLLAFATEDEQQKSGIWTVTLDGGTQNRVVEASGIYYLRWSGNGEAIYYLVRGQHASDLRKVLIDPATGKAAAEPVVVLGGLEARGSFSFSHDRNRLLYSKTSGNADLWSVTLRSDDGGVETRQLTSATVYDSGPRVSPSGSEVAFVRSGNIHIVPIGGGPDRQLTFFGARTQSPAWSPNGAQIAFASLEGGSPRVWRIPAAGGTPRPFENSKLSSSLAVTWAPGPRILYQTPGNRNFRVLDPETEEETPLVADDSVGWVFVPKYSPDGKQVVVNWNRRQPEGRTRSNLWTISLVDSSEARIHETRFSPVSWSQDGEWIYAWDQESSPSRAVGIPATGGEAVVVFEWPFEDKWGMCTTGGDPSRWVCTVGESSADVWLVEDFDAEVGSGGQQP